MRSIGVSDLCPLETSHTTWYWCVMEAPSAPPTPKPSLAAPVAPGGSLTVGGGDGLLRLQRSGSTYDVGTVELSRSVGQAVGPVPFPSLGEWRTRGKAPCVHLARVCVFVCGCAACVSE